MQLSYEAAVAGAIPILRPIRDSLSGDRITRVLGIVNGTTNFILDQMDSTGAQFADALAEAQRLGYAEADPTADVEGYDAAAKAAILASLSFHTRFALEDVSCEGITSVTAADIAAAKEAGFVIKLLAIAEKLTDEDGNTGVSVRVHPTLLPREHPLAAVRGAFNAVFIEAENAGELMFYGQGAGGTPTASAVLGDLVSAARRIVLGGPGRTETTTGHVPVAAHRRGRHELLHRPRRRGPARRPGPDRPALRGARRVHRNHAADHPPRRRLQRGIGRAADRDTPCTRIRTCSNRRGRQGAWTSSIPSHPYCG